MNAIELSGWKNGEEIVLPVNEEEYLTHLQKRCEKSRIKDVEDTVANTNGSFESKKL